MQLRRRREAAGVTRERAGEAIRASPAKISRLELGRVGFKERDVADLLTLYGVVGTSERAEFLGLARQANTPGWWHRYADLLPELVRDLPRPGTGRVGHPDLRAAVRPGAAADRATTPAPSPGSATPKPSRSSGGSSCGCGARSCSPRPGAPTLWAVIDEAALRRTIVGPELTRAQLYAPHRDERAAERLAADRAVHATAGHAAAGGPFAILRFAEPDLPDIVYLEQLTSALYLDKRSDVDHYAAVMDRLCAQVDPPDRTTGILKAIRDEV